jgi:hypothetical protein
VSAPGADCGCCAGVGRRTPLELPNRPGLSAIAYRVGRHSDFLASMIAALTDPSRPGLAALGTRDDDDFSIALIDAWAVTADVLAFYTERLAQESYLRTARERISLQELGGLLGYRLRPGVAAQTCVAFALEPPPAAARTASADPGSAPPVTPASVTIEPGLRVQSIPGPGEQPQTFETVEEVVARPEWNAIPASATLAQTFAGGETTAYLDGATLNLKAGDELLLAGSDIADEDWAVRALTTVTAQPEAGRTRVDWALGLGTGDPPAAPATVPLPYVFRKRLDAFGHNAPQWLAMSQDFRDNYPDGIGADGTRATDWPGFTISAGEGTTVDLDGSHPDVCAGTWVVLSLPDQRELWGVQDAIEVNRADFAVSGKVTRVTLTGGESYDSFAGRVRDLSVFAASEPVALASAPDPSPVGGGSVRVDVDVSGMQPGRRLVVRGTTTGGEPHAEDAVVRAVEVDAAGGGWLITLAADLSTDLDRATAIVHGNVALATHGETVQQLLGSGRASASFQRFALAQGPLTYVQSSADPSGAVDTLEVRVNDVAWSEAATLYAAGSRDRSFDVRDDEAGATVVGFGDGANGSRLPSGTNNVRARYRKGLGAGGNVGAGALAQLIDRPLGVKGASNPSPASGGVDPEAEEEARGSIPLGVRTLGRAVSLLDYEDFARAFSGVAKASASVLTLRTGRTPVVSVAFTGGERLTDLTTALRAFGDPTVDVLVLASASETFRLGLAVAVDASYEASSVLSGVEAALRAAYAFDARELGAPVYLSDVEAVAHGVAGVLAVVVQRLYTGSSPGLSPRLLAQQAAVDASGDPVAAGLLVLDDAPLDRLEALA